MATCKNAPRPPHRLPAMTVFCTQMARHARATTPHPCHCEDRSDAAISSRAAPMSLRGSQRRGNLVTRGTHVIARSAATRQSRKEQHKSRDCFASLAMTVFLTRPAATPRPCHHPSHVIARSAATRQSRKEQHKSRDCFASLAMTIFPTRPARHAHVITPPMSLRGAQRRGNPEKSSTSPEIASLRSQ